jgi:hypothetical protein
VFKSSIAHQASFAASVASGERSLPRRSGRRAAKPGAHRPCCSRRTSPWQASTRALRAENEACHVAAAAGPRSGAWPGRFRPHERRLNRKDRKERTADSQTRALGRSNSVSSFAFFAPFAVQGRCAVVGWAASHRAKGPERGPTRPATIRGHT